ncbi:MAG: tRNA (adenosine(37)-N6)-threonylcarbamoyltransferase complex ATPase subunit type 1 TsaE [Candidatus Hydrothermia bacterium]
MSAFEIRTYSSAETRKIGEILVEHLAAPFNVLLKGELGAGKTELVRGFLAKHGFKIIRSPSFTIVNTFETPNYIVHHIDLFRINSLEEITIRGILDLLEEQDSIRFIEWPELILEEIDKEISVTFTFSILGETTRNIIVETLNPSLQERLRSILNEIK